MRFSTAWSLTWITTLIEAVGLEQVHEPHTKHLEGRLWEMRRKAKSKGKDGIAQEPRNQYSP